MPASSRLQKLEIKLRKLEERFEELLLESLRRCEQGHWSGMFGAHEAAQRIAGPGLLADRLRSEDGEALLGLVASIDELRARLGYTEPNALCSRYLEYRKKTWPK